MTCVWDGLINKIPGLQYHGPDSLIRALQSVNCRPTDVLWNGTKIRESEMRENLGIVDDYDPHDLHDGHLIGACDPFLLLLAQVFRLEIRQEVMSIEPRTQREQTTEHVYRHVDARTTIQFRNDLRGGPIDGHFM